MRARHHTDRLVALVVLALVVSAVGIALGEAVVLLAAIAPIGYLLYGQLTTLPPLEVAVERELSDPSPTPGADVTVTVTVTNTGEHTLPKVHVIDGVPAELGVAGGSPRRASALRPGESTTLTYSVVAKRGVHEFGETYVNGQSFSGSEEREVSVSADGRSTITCHAAVSDPLEREVTHQYTGQLATDEAGTGLEFYAVRDHHHSDPVSRIDWNRYAKEGALTTIEYRERRGAPVVILVDLRSSAEVARRPIDPPASELSVYAAHRVLEPLLEYGNEVGLAMCTENRIEWLPVGRGSNHEARAELAMREAGERAWSENTMTLTDRMSGPRSNGSATSRAVADGSGEVNCPFEALEPRLPSSANVVVVTPVVDAFPRRVGQYLRAFDHHVTVLSPNVVSRDRPGGRVAALERELAISKLRRGGTEVISWDPDDPLGHAIARTLEGQL